MTDYRFKVGMDLQMTGLPYVEALALAAELDARYGWFGDLQWAIDGEITDAAVDEMGEQAARHGVELFMIGAGGAFSKLHLEDLELDTLQDHPEFQADFSHLIQTMGVANRLDVNSVLAYTFAWPGRILRWQTDLAHALANARWRHRRR